MKRKEYNRWLQACLMLFLWFFNSRHMKVLCIYFLMLIHILATQYTIGSAKNPISLSVICNIFLRMFFHLFCCFQLNVQGNITSLTQNFVTYLLMPIVGTLSLVIGEIHTSDSIFSLFHPLRFSLPFSDLVCGFKGISPQGYQIIYQLDSFTNPKDWCAVENCDFWCILRYSLFAGHKFWQRFHSVMKKRQLFFFSFSMDSLTQHNCNSIFC